MNNTNEYSNEQAAATAFNMQAALFDERFSGNTIIQYKRDRVRQHVLKFLKPSSSILELNAGTGEDAIYFAQLGHRVHATDIASGMQAVLREKAKQFGVEAQVSTELCSFTALGELQQKATYDLIFSNFAGLNCTPELNKVLDSFASLLKPGGRITLVMLPGFCLWEFLLLWKGKFRTAFRRFNSKKGVSAHIEGQYFKCWYYNPSWVIGHLKTTYELEALEGLCVFVPPSYIERFSEKYPRAYRLLVKLEDRSKDRWPWNCIGDYYIISLKKKG